MGRCQPIRLAAEMGKTQRHRDLPEPYVLLRHLTALNDDDVLVAGATRTRLLGVLTALFLDYDRPAPPESIAAVLADRLALLVAELELHEAHAASLRFQIEALGETLKAGGAMPPIDEAVSGLSLFTLTRLAGQTGPLSDVASKRQLLR